MRIKKIRSRSRRDIWADFECEHCGREMKNIAAYDDEFYHVNVIPAMVCPQCNKVSGPDYEPMTPKYREGKQV